MPLKDLRTLKIHSNKKPLTYNNNNPKQFTELSKNLYQLKRNDKIKNTYDTIKIIKNKREPKNFKKHSKLM